MSDASTEPVILCEVREKQWKMFGLGVVLTAASAFTATVIANDPDTGARAGLARVAGVAGMCMFGLVLLAYTRRLLRPTRPVLIINSEGFTDHGPMGAGFVPWTEVTELGLWQMNKTTAVVGRVRDPGALDRLRSPLGRVMARLNRSTGDIWVSDATLPKTSQEILDLMVQRWRRVVEG